MSKSQCIFIKCHWQSVQKCNRTKKEHHFKMFTTQSRSQTTVVSELNCVWYSNVHTEHWELSRCCH